MNAERISPLEAYRAMFYFLEQVYEQTSDDGIGILLGSMQLLQDGMPADAAYWNDWQKAVEKSLGNR